ncbi:MAG: hypothetical protein A3I07_01920 [Candidatus Doudnabacteria bacterium RIFCSPLOWO2_02_FULL_42_9]|uniref:Uncharacterized protein n=1 Tax=Candidatus Doudnabacteria bacterium RIFCSPHIGHO2_01_FULL_41_86 TaxID=1817821 RepID=A0A1F5NA46_9BACT|nr:MAG: hypothetical protein A2717_02855 [Candidatus Doudnabacteria bacterium RIFCSPHIGHO2_01_FULL_41_86]OGE74707.1 MAG: hypothetical protein A3K07_00545 [Candidatus Doudnabacteria bacterium RIFCSPHIGHO2_01_43_10]OGE85487.1 MAG: hypothetical protein A3E28_02425 [Candidatus Doudnabacteria bacterium RIFCSPHIGHO2_12_FULL_42_22]OGE87025.1 MAG: hypothetical protein A3C49_03260 [Candidatus Doudnabacteria bacterium RIFCSPHIGHO2_02_FULL_42_25]OGE92624.1 MAG: hypothetical protein A2895_03415 [Candidatus
MVISEKGVNMIETEAAFAILSSTALPETKTYEVPDFWDIIDPRKLGESRQLRGPFYGTFFQAHVLADFLFGSQHTTDDSGTEWINWKVVSHKESLTVIDLTKVLALCGLPPVPPRDEAQCQADLTRLNEKVLART